MFPSPPLLDWQCKFEGAAQAPDIFFTSKDYLKGHIQIFHVNVIEVWGENSSRPLHYGKTIFFKKNSNGKTNTLAKIKPDQHCFYPVTLVWANDGHLIWQKLFHFATLKIFTKSDTRGCRVLWSSPGCPQPELRCHHRDDPVLLQDKTCIRKQAHTCTVATSLSSTRVWLKFLRGLRKASRGTLNTWINT